MAKGEYVKKLLYIPIEIKSRDLDGRLLITLEALKNDFNIIIGKQLELKYLITKYPQGIYFAKSASIADLNNFKNLKNFNHKIAVLDEEAIIHQNEEAHIKSRYSNETLPLIDAILSWGEYDNSVVKKYFPEHINNYYIVGNPRMDLLRNELRSFYKEAKKNLKNKYGKYIIIPSSFAMCNHHTESGARIEWRKSMGMVNKPEDIPFYTNYANHFDSIFKEFLNVIPKLADEFNNYTFIVRPHPSENFNIWIDRFKEYKNIKVIYEGSVIPWLYASELVIHNGCTTGIESFLLDKNVISYRPYISEEYDLDLPNDVSIQVFNYNELKYSITNLLKNKEPSKEYLENGRKVLNDYIDSIEGKFAYEKIVKLLDDISEPIDEDIEKYSFFNHLAFYKEQFIYQSKVKIKQWLRFDFKGSSYGKQKFSGLSESDIRDFIDKIKLDDIKNEDVKIRKVFDNTFLLEK
jgi:surface carbohydrate biosynthesis protein